MSDGQPGDNLGVSGNLFYYDENGAPIVRFDDQRLQIAPTRIFLPDGGRFDFPAHDILSPQNANAVGMVTFVPDELPNGIGQDYYITSTRLFYDCQARGASCTDLLTGFVVPERPATDLNIVGGVSTMRDEISVLEFNNVSEDTASVAVNVFDENGQVMPYGNATEALSLSVPQLGTRHLVINRAQLSSVISNPKQ